MRKDSSATEPLKKPLRFVKGVGEKLSLLFGRKNVLSIQDLLFYLPRTYEDRRRVYHVHEVTMGMRGVVLGKIARSHPVFYSKTRRKTFEVSLEDVNGKLGTLKLTWFHAPYMAKKIEAGTYVLVTGEVSGFRNQLQMLHPELEVLGKTLEGEAEGQGIFPIYSETTGLYQKTIRRILKQTVDSYVGFLIDPLPESLLKKHQFPNLSRTLRFLHSPPADADMDALLSASTSAHKRLIYDEFLQLSVGLSAKKKQFQNADGIAFPVPRQAWTHLKENLSFQFTGAQKRCVQEILKDMTSSHMMHRLVQGDVGSGKTVVAAAAACVALEAGYQVALMAPTELLVHQHRRNFEKWFKGMPFHMWTLTGSSSAAERREILKDLQGGRCGVIFGTHALFEDEVQFRNLGLVIVDEQHRFGVRQRAALVKKGKCPDLLVMTATPIPRTLALTAYGDLDISIIDELPPGRKPIETKVFTERERLNLEKAVLSELKKGRQVYIVFPLIDESEELKLKSLQEMFPALEEAYSPYRVVALHGRLKNDEKNAILEDFRANKIQVLASTTVVEVGVDVPNATVMVIEHAERFGLSQLHQLRGRVGRGAEASYCYLMASHLGTEEIVKRLRAMEKTHDGFKLSEIDLEMRGPGEVLGTRQSGTPIFTMARLPRDLPLLEMARRDAEDLVAADPTLSTAPFLREALKERADRVVLN